jgi:membrane-bound inhibitor of C-type lysozyme
MKGVNWGVMGLVVWLLAGCSERSAAPPMVAEDWRVEQLSYRCEDGEWLQVAYINSDQPWQGLAALYYQGALHILRVGVSASGVRYVPLAGETGPIWHVKGEEGVLGDGADSQQAWLSCSRPA